MALYNAVIDFLGGKYLGIGFCYRVGSHSAGGSQTILRYQVWRINCPLAMQGSPSVSAVNAI
ncbi:hypothetical protein D3C77_407160 [compost metagenome]